MCALYLSHTNFVTYVPVLGAEQFQFPCGVIFDGFLAKDEQKPKLKINRCANRCAFYFSYATFVT